jgi:hypothetical protein
VSDPIFGQSDFDVDSGVLLQGDALIGASARVLRSARCEISTFSYIGAAATTTTPPAPSVEPTGPSYFHDSGTMVGTYAVSGVGFRQKLKNHRGDGYIFIEFNFGETKYRGSFFAEKNIDVLIRDIVGTISTPPPIFLSLESIEGDVAWKR